MGGFFRNWIGSISRRKRSAPPSVLLASRDLPPVDAATGLTLPRAPMPFSDNELSFALRAAAERTRPMRAAPLSIANGADLRGQLERFQQQNARREALAEASKAYAAVAVHGLAEVPEREAPSLRLVSSDAVEATPDDDSDLDMKVETALTIALSALQGVGRRAEKTGG